MKEKLNQWYSRYLFKTGLSLVIAGFPISFGGISFFIWLSNLEESVVLPVLLILIMLIAIPGGIVSFFWGLYMLFFPKRMGLYKTLMNNPQSIQLVTVEKVKFIPSVKFTFVVKNNGRKPSTKLLQIHKKNKDMIIDYIKSESPETVIIQGKI